MYVYVISNYFPPTLGLGTHLAFMLLLGGFGFRSRLLQGFGGGLCCFRWGSGRGSCILSAAEGLGVQVCRGFRTLGAMCSVSFLIASGYRFDIAFMYSLYMIL